MSNGSAPHPPGIYARSMCTERALLEVAETRWRGTCREAMYASRRGGEVMSRRRVPRERGTSIWSNRDARPGRVATFLQTQLALVVVFATMNRHSALHDFSLTPISDGPSL
jgi:hypothetical protein